MKRGEPGISCVVLVDKPEGPTSFDMVRVARRGIGGRVGHAGTLDPFASGLLLLMIGHATRVSSLLMELPKEYEVTVQFGAISTTADPTGNVISTGGRVREHEVEALLDRFRGRIRQRVPLTSAVKVKGERLYQKAHRGEHADTPERDVTVHKLSMVAFDDDNQTARLALLTGKGTYVRMIAEDLGSASGAGGYARALRRTRIGHFSVEDAVSPEDLSVERYVAQGRGVLGLDEALDFIPKVELDGRQARLAANGNELPDAPIGRFRVYGPDGLLGVYEGRAGGARPLVVFPAQQPM